MGFWVVVHIVEQGKIVRKLVKAQNRIGRYLGPYVMFGAPLLYIMGDREFSVSAPPPSLKAPMPEAIIDEQAPKS